MTTTTSVNKFRYEGNGATDTFAFTGRIFSSADLVVEIITRATDALVETLVITTHYTVTINGDESASIVVIPSKIPSASQDIQIRRSLAKTQTLDLPTGTVFPAESVEDALDRNVSIIQDQAEEIDRSIKLPATSSLTDIELPSATASTVIGWNSGGTNLTNYTFGSINTAIDTSFTSLATNDLLTYNGTNWVNITRANAGIGNTEFADNVFRIQDNSDATKELAFECSGITTATTRTVTIPDKSGTLAMTSDIPTVKINRNYINGMRLSLDTDVDHDILVASGQCANNGNTDYETLSAGITKQIDATFAAGDDAGGMFTGSVANDTNYYFCIIKKDSDSTIDAGFDTSSSGANTPSGYTFIRAIGVVRTDGSANIKGITEYRSDRNVYTCVIGQTITNAGALTLTHLLGGIPTEAPQMYIKNTTTNLNYSTGDIIYLNNHMHFVSAGTGYGVSVVPDSTTLNVRFGSGGIYVMNKTTGAVATITNGNWSFFIQAERKI